MIKTATIKHYTTPRLKKMVLLARETKTTLVCEDMLVVAALVEVAANNDIKINTPLTYAQYQGQIDSLKSPLIVDSTSYEKWLKLNKPQYLKQKNKPPKTVGNTHL